MSGYNKEYNIVFIHIPKTAGTSMEEILFGKFEGHSSIHTLKQNMSIENFNKAFKFAFVRNPYDRFISLRNYGTKLDDFERCVKHISNRKQSFYPQADFICDEDNNILVDFVGRFESLEKDWNKICDIIDIDSELPHIRTGDAVIDYTKKYYTDKTKKIISQYYTRDFEIFGYEVNESKEVSPPSESAFDREGGKV